MQLNYRFTISTLNSSCRSHFNSEPGTISFTIHGASYGIMVKYLDVDPLEHILYCASDVMVLAA